ncbi:MAG: RNase adapter RapZ [Myxococcales bacterium]|nr:RNase adapter RapZ [Myxococcales bacterium]
MSRSTNVVVVAGLSGAGKSTALAALEDLGYHAIENLPPPVIEHAITACEQAGIRDIALGFNAFAAEFLSSAAEVVETLARDARAATGAGPARRVTVLFLDASDEALLRRYSETRRPHPALAAADASHEHAGAHAEVKDGIRLERQRLAPLRALAASVIDTSGMRVHDLRRRVLGVFKPETVSALRMSVRILSFGFKYGLPSDSDLVYDVRFLDNPHFVDELRPLTGLDIRVRDYVLGSENASRFLALTVDSLDFLLPLYEAEGKSYLTIAVGCTGGQHRSVSIAIALAERLGQRGHTGIRLVHRDAAPLAPPADAAQGGSR